jgi:hypothetical protein
LIDYEWHAYYKWKICDTFYLAKKPLFKHGLLEKFTGGSGSSIAGCFVEGIELPVIST